MSAEEKANIAAGVAEEIIKDAGELKALYERKEHPCCYDGFEPSGRMHIAQGLQRAMNTNALTSTGVKFVFWVADYFAFMNHKMDGDMKKIQDCGYYMIEVWRACGMDLTNVEFVWASEFINMYSGKYWFNVLQIALRNRSVALHFRLPHSSPHTNLKSPCGAASRASSAAARSWGGTSQTSCPRRRSSTRSCSATTSSCCAAT